MRRKTFILLAAALLSAGAAREAAAKHDRIRQDLSPAADSEAIGRTRLVVRADDNGRFEIRVWNLAPDSDYDIVIGNVKVGTLTTMASGFGRARFRSRPRRHDLLLGFDPRGQVVSVRDAAGQDVLTGLVPTGTPPEEGDLICCIPDDSGAECEDRTADECTAQGGTVSTATSCLPNPCADVPPPTDADIVCCVPDDSGPECEDRTVAECATEGGLAVEATSCDPNPCAASTPAGGDDHGGGGEDEAGDDHGGHGGGGHHGGDDTPEVGGNDDRGGAGGEYY